MYRNIVVPLDGSKKGEMSLPVARQLAESTGCTLHLVVAISMDKVLFIDRDDTLPNDFEKLGNQQMDTAAAYLAELAAALKSEGVSVETHVCHQDPAKGIVSYAKQHGADLIVLTRKIKSNLQRWLGGSVTTGILRNAPCAVMVVRPEAVSG